MSKLHVAIIMDGNGRWAQSRRRPRLAGHQAGADAVRRTVEAAPGLGIGVLTLYAFSSDNWKRPSEEVAGLMRLLGLYLQRETARCVKNGVRVSIIGRRDRLPSDLLPLIESAERETRNGTRLHLRVAVDYSARDSILRAASVVKEVSRESFAHALGRACHCEEAAPDVDLLIRTGGEQRLSDFLLWECAYAELHFTPTMWPDFSAADLEAALADFRRRQRRFGGLPALAAG
ncbi:MAG: di-trans,poly-cis-decaprenylcistransferase [Bryobacteraceae bacterium]|jgi:undecaprenyl diphosphate synthase|nr:di-trans,poly-cis-decaprenylcistransferase [Bryobacteraceae bacterium]